MTGELADLFADRDEGVRQIVATLKRRFGERRLHVFAGERGFLDPGSRASESGRCGLGQLARDRATDCGPARRCPAGRHRSTTTDLVAVRGGRVVAAGRTDFERLVSGELVYTGVVRTPLMALGDAESSSKGCALR